MATEIFMPKLGMSMTEGSIVRWMRKDGDTISKGEPLFEVQTDKVVIEAESPGAGVLKILTGEGIVVPVFTTIGWVLAPGEKVPEAGAGALEVEQAVSAKPPEEVAKAAPGESAMAVSTVPGRIPASPAAKRIAREVGVDLTAVKGTGPGGRIVANDVEAFAEAMRVKASPVARRMAQEAGLDLSKVTGTGPGGRITKEDVEREAAKPAVAASAPTIAPVPAVPVGAETIPVAGIRKVIFERMAYSSNTVARVTEFVEVDATDLVALRTQLKAELQKTEDVAVGYNDLLIMIVAKALHEHPLVNSTIADREIKLLPQINIGLAVDTERGLLVPVIRDADRKSLVEIVREVRALASRAVAGASLPDDLTGGTFTITNLGMYEIDGFTPIVNLPESAILGVGRIQAKPAVYEGQIAIRQMMILSLSFDHRSIDGAPAARFLQRVKHLIEKPYLLLM